MPLYDYRCKECGHRFSKQASIEERKNVICPRCQSQKVEQLITGCSINTGGCGSGVSVPSGG